MQDIQTVSISSYTKQLIDMLHVPSLQTLQTTES